MNKNYQFLCEFLTLSEDAGMLKYAIGMAEKAKQAKNPTLFKKWIEAARGYRARLAAKNVDLRNIQIPAMA